MKVGLRELLNRHPKLAAAGAGVLVIGGLIAAVLSAGASGGPRPVGEGKAYFSVDDGKSWFAAPASNPSPFLKDGKPAYRVLVWRTGRGDPFVSHLYRSSSAAVAPQADPVRSSPTAAHRTPPALSGSAIEVKRPGTGEKGWVRADSVEGEAIAKPHGPDGTTNALEAVEP